MASDARTVADLERKYNFAELLGLTKNIKMNSKSIIKVENELVNMLNSLIINLKDVLDSQSDVSLWFYSGTPTTTNKPYIDWINPEEHYGDIYYDQATGYVYQFNSTGWQIKEDTSLIQAMALTNAELDTTIDHERKVYFSEPSPPYSSGDWWILEDGTLKICQLSKDSSETYDIQDFVVSSKYVATIASKTGDTVTVLKGIVTTISDTYVSVTDLATGGSTIINGANITTGTINTDNVSIGNDNVLINEDGIQLNNGAKVIGENGLMNTYLFKSGDKFGVIGYFGGGTTFIPAEKEGIEIEFAIPEGLNILSAVITLFHTPIKWDGTYWGYARNLRLYKANNLYERQINGEYSGDYIDMDTANYTEIVNALGSGGYTPPVPTEGSHNTSTKVSEDLKQEFIDGNGNTIPGLYKFRIETGDTIDPEWSNQDLASRTGFAYALLKIDGYMTYDNSETNRVITEDNNSIITEDGKYIVIEGG